MQDFCVRGQLCNALGLSIRVACQAFQVSQSCYRYEAKASAENEAIANWLLHLTELNRPGF